MMRPDNLLHDLTILLAELEDYLLSPELFWPLSTKTQAIAQDRLTLGNLLLCFDHLEALRPQFSVQSEATLRKHELFWQQATEKWKTAIRNKASQEASARINIWRSYLMDLDDGKAREFTYSHEIRNRVIIERVLSFGLSVEGLNADLQSLDQLLRSLTVPGDFQWEPELKTQYPPEPYWFLYRMPRKQLS
jgi:hypothetical protein